VNDEVFINPWKLFHGSQVPNWLLERKEVSPGAKLCYARLCQYAGENGSCYPALDTLAKEMGVSVDSVTRYVQELVKEGLIKSVRRGFKKSNVYFFKPHEWISAWFSLRNMRIPESVKMPDHESANMPTPESAEMRHKEIQGEESHLRESGEAATAPSKVNGKRAGVRNTEVTPEWLAGLKDLYLGIDVDRESKKALAWVRERPGRQYSRKFVLNWLNRATPGAGGKTANAKPKAASITDFLTDDFQAQKPNEKGTP